MPSASPSSAQNPSNDIAAAGPNSAAPSATTTPSAGAVPAQLPAVRSYASAATTKTATPTPSVSAGASTQNAKPSATGSPVNNGTMAHGGPQAAGTSNPQPAAAAANANAAAAPPAGIANGTEHARKPSVVISASGASGYTPNGGPVGQNGNRMPITFGTLPPQSSSPFHGQQAALQQPTSRDARVVSPAHSPSPIPQPPVSGGRPPHPSSLQNHGNTPNFGQLQGDGSDQTLPTQGFSNSAPMHGRRPSSHSMQSDMSNHGMPNRNFIPPNGGRGRGFNQFGGAMSTPPPPQYRGVPGQGRGAPNMGPQFQQPPGSPYNRGGRSSPAVVPPQPHMQPHNQQMGYPYQPALGPNQHNMYGGYDPYPGYQPYPYYPYAAQPPPQSPRPGFPTPYGAPPQGVQAQFHPPSMSRSASSASERPSSSMGHTPAMQSQQPAPQQQQQQQAPAAQPSQSSNFVRPVKKSNAIKITNDKGEAITFGKPPPAPATAATTANSTTTTATAASQNPLIVTTPKAPTPPPKTPSGQHNRNESKNTKSAEETKASFQEQVKKQMEEAKRKEAAEESAKQTQEDEAAAKATQEAEAAARDELKKATAEAEKAAAIAASDKKAEEEAEAAKRAAEDEEARKRKEEAEENERIEREIAEMEAREREEEERERAYQEKRKKEREEAAAKEAERAAKEDEELRRQEREAEEREAERERERERREQETDAAKDEPDDESKKLFAALKRPTLGPGASAPDSGTETPKSEDSVAATQPQADAAAAQARAGSAKPKPTHLKLETTKRVEPAEPTPGMQSLKSARILKLSEEAKYPDGFTSPNPALNQNGTKKARAYDMSFLLQFQNIFKEKPSVDWDQKVKETLGSDDPGSARPASARTASTSARAGRAAPSAVPSGPFGGTMGQFAGPMGGRTLPPNTTSAERFAASSMGPRPGGMVMPGAVGRNMPINAPGVGMNRTGSMQHMQIGPGSPRQSSARKGPSKRDDRAKSKREEADQNSKMPLTAGMDLKGLEKSSSGWKPMSLGQGPAGNAPDLNGNMAPDLVQRKVKAALNKMTPENFERISNQILDIASQSRNESDGRTLRQVIALTFEKACDEAHWAGMYARFCHKMLSNMNSDIRDETIKDKAGNPVIGGALFRKYLLNRCQEEFERGWQANLPEKPEGETQEAALLSDEYYKAAAAKRKGLGLIQFIGQLYKLNMLTLRIMHECVMRLLNFEGDPDEAAVENLTTLLRSVGGTMNDVEQGRVFLDMYFERIDKVFVNSDALASRPKFMVMDLIDLRRAGWEGKDTNKGPKTLEEIHKEAEAQAARAAAEAARSNVRGGPGGGRPLAGRGDSRNFSGGMPPPVDLSRTNVAMDDLRRLQQRGSSGRSAGGNLVPGGGLGPSGMLSGGRSGSRRGLGPGSNPSTRTSTPPIDSKDKKDEPSASTNAFAALAGDSGEVHEEAASDAASPPTARNRSRSPLAGDGPGGS